MQPIYDVLNAGGPLVRSVWDFTTSLMIPMSEKEQVKKPPVNVAQKMIPHSVQVNFVRNWVRLGGLSGALAIGLGAYGAHIIERNDKFSEEQKRSYRTANMYHFMGTFGIVACSLSKYPAISGSLMALGTLLFSGSCYYYAVTGDDSIKKYAPFGGSTMIAAFLSLCL